MAHTDKRLSVSHNVFHCIRPWNSNCQKCLWVVGMQDHSTKSIWYIMIPHAISHQAHIWFPVTDVSSANVPPELSQKRKFFFFTNHLPAASCEGCYNNLQWKYCYCVF